MIFKRVLRYQFETNGIEKDYCLFIIKKIEKEFEEILKRTVNQKRKPKITNALV